MDKENILQEAGLTEEDIVINPYNPFDYLQTQEEIDEYLQDAFMDDNLHPTAAAQPRLLEHVWPALAPLLDAPVALEAAASSD